MNKFHSAFIVLTVGCIVSLAGLTAGLAGASAAQDLSLGRISFPNSGNAAAQDAFIRGVLNLHNFSFTDAQEDFKAAQQADPDFALAYWGEAMSRNWPLWHRVYSEEGRAALLKLGPTLEARLARAPTEREKGFLRAVDHLFFDEGDKAARDRAYGDEMARLYAQYPEDPEVASFYALSLLGLTNGVRDFRNYMKAASIVEEVMEANPQHPGAAHYLIHSYDDPIHAPLGLRAARVYSQLAPDSSHAQHMISHIYVALGMWDEAVTANRKAWAVSQARRERKKLGIDRLDFHSFSWLHYGLLQQGRVEEARKMLAVVDEAYQAKPTPGIRYYRSYMRASQVVETGATGSDLPPLENNHMDQYADAMAALRRGDLEKARALTDALGGDEVHEKIHKMELQSLLLLREGQKEEALALLQKAAAEEDARPLANGPPEPIKPSEELLGEVLLELGRPAEARMAFETALQRAPRRAVSLLGLARTMAALGDTARAREIYSVLQTIWHKADASLAALNEVTAGVGATGKR